MRVLGVDLGESRIGIAVSDSGGTIATPHAVLKRSGSMKIDHAELAQIAGELQVERIVVGLPLSLDGSMGPAARATTREVEEMSHDFELPIEMFDERFTTVTAQRSMRAVKVKERKRRNVVDQMAAAVMLQNWLERTRHA